MTFYKWSWHDIFLDFDYDYRVLIFHRGHPSGAANHAAALRQEGVVVTRGNMGELLVDFKDYGWFVQELPSERTHGNGSSGGEDSE